MCEEIGSVSLRPCDHIFVQVQCNNTRCTTNIVCMGVKHKYIVMYNTYVPYSDCSIRMKTCFECRVPVQMKEEVCTGVYRKCIHVYVHKMNAWSNSPQLPMHWPYPMTHIMTPTCTCTVCTYSYYYRSSIQDAFDYKSSITRKQRIVLCTVWAVVLRCTLALSLQLIKYMYITQHYTIRCVNNWAQ